MDAIAAMAPASRINSDSELEAIDVPTLIVSGTLDETTPIDPETERAWDHVGGRPLWRVDITDAGHQSFTDVCAYQELLPTLESVPEVLVEVVDEFALEGCADELIPIDDAHDLINRATVAFMLAYVAGETDYVGFLSNGAPDETVQVRD